MISASLATRPAGSSGAATATASRTTARTASQGRAPCIAQPNARALPIGIRMNAIQVMTSALADASVIATTVATIASGPTSAQPAPRSRSSTAGAPAAGSATHSDCAASSSSRVEVEVHVTYLTLRAGAARDALQSWRS